MRFLLLTIALLLSVVVNAQSVVAIPDTNSIELGEQTYITLTVNYRVDQGKDVSVSFPIIEDTLIKEIEVIKVYPIDTVISEDLLQFSLSQKILISSFEIGSYQIPSFEFLVNERNLKTPNIPFEVRDVLEPIQDAKAIGAIKDPLRDPLTFWEKHAGKLKYYIIGLVIWILIGGLVYLWIELRGKPKKEKEIAVLVRPGHVIALEKLTELDKKALWQNNKTKQYYSELSEIMRSYLEGRFKIGALEHTTEEIIKSLKFAQLSVEQLESLHQILTSSDFVKFAKENPIGTDNERVLEHAIKFIELTKIEGDNA